MSIAPERSPGSSRPRALVLVALIGLAALQLAAGLGQPVPVTSRGPGSSPVAASLGPAPATSGPIASGSSAGPGAGPVASAGPGTSPSPAIPPTSRPGSPSPYLLPLLDAHLETVRVFHGIPAITATILFQDGSRWTGASGLADVSTGTVVRPGTPFSIASISKTFTAALILQLVEQGRLKLTDSAAARLAGVAGISLDRRITIAQLLDHTSGLRDFFLNEKIEAAFAAAPDAVWTASQAFAYAGRPLAAPGLRYYYSNTNYLLLGLIAERVTRKPLQSLLRERFFEPLSLRTVSYQGVDASYLPLARAYRFTTGSPTEPPIALPGAMGIMPFAAAVTASGGAGSLAASAPDTATWARALYDGKVLGPAMTAAMVGDAARTTAVDPQAPYGYGVQVVPIDGHGSFGHSGRYLGARAVVRHFPVDGLTISVLTNQSRIDPGVVLIDLLRLGLLAQGSAAAGGEG